MRLHGPLVAADAHDVKGPAIFKAHILSIRRTDSPALCSKQRSMPDSYCADRAPQRWRRIADAVGLGATEKEV
jgi:hypothetical protein